MINSFRSRALKNYWIRNDSSGIRPDWKTKVRLILNILERANSLNDFQSIGFGFHGLTGNYQGRYSMIVSKNWRITFSFVNDKVEDIDLEDYHA